MTRTHARASRAKVLAGLAAMVVLPGLAPPSPAQAAPTPTPTTSAPAATGVSDTVAPADRDKVLQPGWRTSKDVAWTKGYEAYGRSITDRLTVLPYTWNN